MARRVRTSHTDPIDIGWLEPQEGGCVGLTFAPGKKCGSLSGEPWERDLAVDLERLRAHHRIDLLLCLLEDHELVTLGIAELERHAQAAGIAVHRLAIRDGDVPEDAQAVERICGLLVEAVSAGKRAVIHCAGGLGRSGTIGGCYLVHRGSSAEDAMQRLTDARGPRCPENDRQRSFIRRYAAAATAGGPHGQSRSAARQPTYRDVLAGVVSVDLLATATAPAERMSKRDLARTLAEIEAEVRSAPEECFETRDNRRTTLRAAGRTYAAGRFRTPSISELQRRSARRNGAGRVRFSVLLGANPITDIGTLQAVAEPGVLFQVASQFNCLEAPGAQLVPVQGYVSDPTQGPRASVSAFPGTFLRHYHAAGQDGSTFTQTEARQINLLADVLDERIATVKHGYLTTSDIGDPNALAALLEERFERIRVGVHDDVEVVGGHDWTGPVPRAGQQRIAQVFTSTVALGGYSVDDGSPALATIRRQLLRGAYLGTLLAALDLGQRAVVLTCIGGGVFGNPHRDIWNAILWALEQIDPLTDAPPYVVLNARSLEASVPAAEIAEHVAARDGVVATER